MRYFFKGHSKSCRLPLNLYSDRDVHIAAIAGAIRQTIPSTCTSPSYVHEERRWLL
ncbi:hypothetical protein PILCRDRAFT_830108 [Piloderma croceum F 1598]|uniref:Uncharacterized protein n=1 Tax=Piloderma croceum (strain F 1598) TaxID=765440 RepID=A0A0C3EGN4_PILCF|nr:hypothetical protein PILCRDRAFT_830108 [Piloderma croceum F 1598]